MAANTWPRRANSGRVQGKSEGDGLTEVSWADQNVTTMTLTQRILLLFLIGLSSVFAFVAWWSLNRTGPIRWLDAAIGIALFVIAGVAWTGCLAVALLARQRGRDADNKD